MNKERKKGKKEAGMDATSWLLLNEGKEKQEKDTRQEKDGKKARKKEGKKKELKKEKRREETSGTEGKVKRKE